MIYTLGNSHAHLFTNTHPGLEGWGKSTKFFRSFSARPLRAETFAETHLYYFFQFILPKFDQTDFMLFSVGERDCAQHIPVDCVHSSQPVNVVLKKHADKFLEVVDRFKQHGIPMIGWGGHPTVDTCFLKNTSMEHDENFLVGISLEWNNYLKEQYISRGIPFISIVEDLLTPDGKVDLSFFPVGDTVHLNYQMVAPLLEKRFKEAGFDVDFPPPQLSA